MATIAIISYIGGSNFVGLEYIPNRLDQIIVAAVSLIFFYWGKNTPYYKE